MYQVTQDTLYDHGGGGLMSSNYSGSPQMIITTLYPDYNWKKWSFNKVQLSMKEELHSSLLSCYLDFIGTHYYVLTYFDWYRISNSQIRSLGVFQAFRKEKGLSNVLQNIYSSYVWDDEKLTHYGKRSTQRWLYVMMKKLFSIYNVYEEYYHTSLKYPKSDQPIQLDIFIPELSLAVEYQGQQHYVQINLFGEFRSFIENDRQKAIACKNANITLIHIPYWWDLSESSLVGTILHHRPDLVKLLPEGGQKVTETFPHGAPTTQRDIAV
eukprot:TRINITY_DN7515_c0_g1_i3.p1 TRINITY_DN7515_c0_g1~~TRINITY_DN7515_c0_g1_i3.p1  ORF type:complete len:268 (-),score=47.11 TRINITY_DN7515_c0_g1_i3:290-1093(-)